MRTFKRLNNRLPYSFIGGVLCLGLFKLYMYTANKEQFEDSNLLVSLAFALIVTAFIYLFLWLMSTLTSSRK
jgi:hypothetical protein